MEMSHSIKRVSLVAAAALVVGLAACGYRIDAQAPETSRPNNVTETNSSVTNEQNKQLRLQNVEQEVERLLALLTLEEKVSLVHANGKFTIPGIERLGITEMWMSDGPHGVRQEISRDSWAPAGWTDDHSTYLPPLTAVAASWDPEMARLHGNVLGSEARHRRKDIILGPGVNLARLPIYGRNFEYFGEDPYLAGKLVTAEIRAIQEHDVAACVKHYALNSQELNRFGVNAKPDERTLREVYLPAFEAAVKEGGVYTVMGGYNQVHGTNANQSKHLVMDILKGEWGFKGVLLTDWNVDINTYDAAVNGLDIEMGTHVESYDDYFLASPFLAMLREGRIPESVLDDKVRRILRVQLSIGMMDPERDPGQRNTPGHRAAARQIAEHGVVLLKNANATLPLQRNKLKTVLVIGPNANQAHGAGGGSSQVKALHEVTPLQGLREKLGDGVEIINMRARSGDGLLPIAGDYVASRDSDTGTPAWQLIVHKDRARQGKARYSWIPDSAYTLPLGDALRYVTLIATIAPLESGTHTLKFSALGELMLRIDGKTVYSASREDLSIQEHGVELEAGRQYQFELLYEGNQQFMLGWAAPGSLYTDREEYMAAARAADAVIYFGGLSHADDRESQDRASMMLPNLQDSVIDDLLTANPSTVVFMIGGSAVEMPWADRASTLVWGWYGGMEAGHAYADILFGDSNPSGKLPITMPARLEDTAPIALDDYNAKESLYKEGVFIGYRWFEQQQLKPLFHFGHGLSYTTFKYDAIRLSQPAISGADELEVRVKVTNTGARAGAEVVQLYVQDIAASVERPAKELKGFGKVFLQPGETGEVVMTLNRRDLSFWDVNSNDWLAEPGAFRVHVGASIADIKLTADFELAR